MWTAPSCDGGTAVTKYVVEERLSGTEEFAVVAEPDGSTCHVTLTDLRPGSSHDLRVFAENAIGRSAAAGQLESPLVLKVPGERSLCYGDGTYVCR